MRIGDLARECSVNPKTIRYYESFGLLPKAARAPSGHRMYSEQDLQRPRLRELITAQLTEIEGRIKEFRALERELRGHYASLCQRQAKPPTGAPCSCLDTSPRKTTILPAGALVRRPP